MTAVATGPRSNRNPILKNFRKDTRYWGEVTAEGRVREAYDWAAILTAKATPPDVWLVGATVSQQVFAARVLYRYAAVFGGAS